MTILFQYEYRVITFVSELIGRDRKIAQHSVGSAPPSYFGTDHVTVLSTPPWKTEKAENSGTDVPAHLVSVLPVRSKKSKGNS